MELVVKRENIELVVKRENRPDRTTYRQSFGNGRIPLNVAALRSTAAESSSGRHCCPGLRCAFGCAFRCFFPPLRGFACGRRDFWHGAHFVFARKLPVREFDGVCGGLLLHASIQQLAEFVVLHIS